VLDGPKKANMLQQPGSKLNQTGLTLNALKLQQQLVQGMQLLFTEAVVPMPGRRSSNSSASAGNGTRKSAGTAQSEQGANSFTLLAAAAGARKST
jgi:hypothetical protein